MRVRVSAQVPVAGLPGPEPVPVAEPVLAPEAARPSPGPARVPALAEVPLAGPALAREAVPLSLAPVQAAHGREQLIRAGFENGVVETDPTNQD